MRVSRTTRHGLCAALEMAMAGEQPVTVAEVARHHGIPESALAKVFQRLVRRGLAVGSRGVGGGHRLARDPSSITVADVIDALEAPPPEPGPTPADPVEARLRSLFDEVDGTSRSTLASVSLATLARRPPAAG